MERVAVGETSTRSVQQASRESFKRGELAARWQDHAQQRFGSAWIQIGSAPATLAPAPSRPWGKSKPTLLSVKHVFTPQGGFGAGWHRMNMRRSFQRKGRRTMTPNSRARRTTRLDGHGTTPNGDGVGTSLALNAAARLEAKAMARAGVREHKSRRELSVGKRTFKYNRKRIIEPSTEPEAPGPAEKPTPNPPEPMVPENEGDEDMEDYWDREFDEPSEPLALVDENLDVEDYWDNEFKDVPKTPAAKPQDLDIEDYWDTELAAP